MIFATDLGDLKGPVIPSKGRCLVVEGTVERVSNPQIAVNEYELGRAEATR